jgi:hypothetical protein
MKLYRNQNYPNRWYAFSPETRWVMFPAEAGGWAKREPARGIDPIHLREVAVRLASNTGIPREASAMAEPRGGSDSQLGEAA